MNLKYSLCLKSSNFKKVLCPKFTVVWFLFEITVPSSHEDLCISDLADVSTEKYIYGSGCSMYILNGVLHKALLI